MSEKKRLSKIYMSKELTDEPGWMEAANLDDLIENVRWFWSQKAHLGDGVVGQIKIVATQNTPPSPDNQQSDSHTQDED